MIFCLRVRFRGSVLIFALFGIMLCSIICFTSAASSPHREKRISLVLTKPRHNNNNYYDDNYNNNHERIMQRSSRPARPTSDTDFAEERRGSLDTDGRTLIFKSLILAPLALVVLILFIVLLIPIPVISNPIAAGRGFQSSSSSGTLSSTMYTLQMAREVLTSEECIERVSCELSKISRSHDSTSWIPTTLEKLLTKTKWSERIVRGINGISPSSCSQFTCTPAKNLKKTLRNVSMVH